MGWVRDQIRTKKTQRILPGLARRRLDELRAARRAIGIDWDRPAIELVHLLSPLGSFEVAHHLAPYGALLDTALGSNLRVVLAAPPQHSKTETTKAGLIRAMVRAPRRRFAYVTYNQVRSERVSASLQRAAQEAGLEVTGNLGSWRIGNGAEIVFTSIGGSLTGDPVDGGLIVDDPVKDEEEARSARMRDRADDWLESVGIPRVHPGAFVIVMATRWHVDDLSGRCVKSRDWPYLNFQAIADGPLDPEGRVKDDPLHRLPGEALWPSQRPLEFLAERQRNAWTWASLYQGEPRARGSEVFAGEPPRYATLPRTAFRAGHGIDLAYTARTSADWSVCLSGRRYGSTLYVTNVIRKQVKATDFVLSLKTAASREKAPMVWFVGGVERGSADFIAQKIPNFSALPASSDKFTRAQPASEQWRAGEIVFPSEESPYYDPAFEEVIDELRSFTGVNDPHDDCVDALAALVEAAAGAILTPSERDATLPSLDYASRWEGVGGRGF